jgi:hypothetical protein
MYPMMMLEAVRMEREREIREAARSRLAQRPRHEPAVDRLPRRSRLAGLAEALRRLRRVVAGATVGG